MPRTAWFAIFFAAAAAGQGTEPRANAAAYEVQAPLGDLTIGADYLVHSIPASYGYLITNDYLVIETALFGPRFASTKLALSDFHLRVTLNKNQQDTTPIEAQPPSSVYSSIREQDRGFGGGPLRAPGDPNRPPPPNSPGRVPTSINTGIDRQPPPPIDQQIAQVALPEGDRKVPVSGVLFFPFKGKTTNIKSLELIYAGPAGNLTLKLF